MSMVLYHHPFTRAATAVRMLEEVGVPYDLRHVDLTTGAQKSAEFLALNPMGKLPVLVDGDVVVTETAAIGLYLADRYASGRLAPTPDDPARGPYLRWSLFAPSVIEPAAAARAAGATYREGSVGWGGYDAMVDAITTALTPGPWILGERFSMADVIVGSTLGFLVRFQMVDARPPISAHQAALLARPAIQAADARNAVIIAERGLG